MTTDIPNEQQRAELCKMLARLLVEIRELCGARLSEQCYELADLSHNLPEEMIGLGLWDLDYIEQLFVGYQTKFHIIDYPGRTDYVTWLRKIRELG